MRRREFIAALTGAATPFLTWPLAARAQSVRRVGVLMNSTATQTLSQSYVAAFVEALRQLGWRDDQNLRVDIRWNAGDAALARIYAAQLIGLMPDVILTASTTNLMMIREATNTVPTVFVQVSDPVAQGFVASMARPGGNITGFSMYEFSVGGKWVGLLKQISPDLARVAVMFNPDTSPQSKFYMRAIEAGAPSLGVSVVAVPVRATEQIEAALAKFAQQPNGGLVLPTDTFTSLRLELIADLAIRNRLPSISTEDKFVRGGGLMSYGVANIIVTNQFRQAATYVDRILNGAKPGDLPVQGPDKYRFAINLKTAKALGLTASLPLLGLADEVIE
jgi:putative ABC transport system substrate-binding protein